MYVCMMIATASLLMLIELERKFGDLPGALEDYIRKAQKAVGITTTVITELVVVAELCKQPVIFGSKEFWDVRDPRHLKKEWPRRGVMFLTTSTSSQLI